MSEINDWLRESRQDLLAHIEDEWHVDCHYCYLIQEGKASELPVGICSVHMAWLEQRYRNMLFERRKTEIDLNGPEPSWDKYNV